MYVGDSLSGSAQKHPGVEITTSSSRGYGHGITATCNENMLRVNHQTIQTKDISAANKKRVSRIVDGGLRQFSIIVCNKVESKRRTTYNEVADELIAEFSATRDVDEFDEKNIRRRVYDALNVLMALDIITKDKKEIQWKGLPTTDMKDLEELKALNSKLTSRIGKKKAYLQELEEQLADLQNLMLRNQQFYKTGKNPSEGFSFPLVLVQTCRNATVEIEISEDMKLVHFDFNSTPFSLHDHAYILKQMCHDRLPEYIHVSQSSMGYSASSSSSLQLCRQVRKRHT